MLAMANERIPATNRGWFLKGLKNGIPICLGYFAVAFALGIAARDAGIGAGQAFFMSLGMMASAGEFAAITLIGQSAGIFEMITTTIVVNLRYFLMSCSLSQKLDEKMAFFHRFFLAQTLTDEIYALSVMVPGKLCPFYGYGLFLISAAGWCSGTSLGVIMGSILPDAIVSALSVALYGMFLAIIIPPAKEQFSLVVLIIVSMACSAAMTYLPVLNRISSGFRVILLTLLLSSLAAFLFPVYEKPVSETEGV